MLLQICSCAGGMPKCLRPGGWCGCDVVLGGQAMLTWSVLGLIKHKEM